MTVLQVSCAQSNGGVGKKGTVMEGWYDIVLSYLVRNVGNVFVIGGGGGGGGA